MSVYLENSGMFWSINRELKAGNRMNLLNYGRNVCKNNWSCGLYLQKNERQWGCA